MRHPEVTVNRFLNTVVSWLRAGYPTGVPKNDYLPILALLSRRLTKEEVLLVARFDEFVDQGGGGFPQHAVTTLAGGEAQAEGEMGFTGAAVADGDEVFVAVDEAASGKVHDQGFVQAGDGEEIEAVEGFGDGKTRGFDTALDEAAFAVNQFHFHQAQQVADVIDVLGGALLG